MAYDQTWDGDTRHARAAQRLAAMEAHIAAQDTTRLLAHAALLGRIEALEAVLAAALDASLVATRADVAQRAQPK